MNIDIAILLSSFELNKPFFSFLMEIFKVIAITPGRHCFRQLARYSGYEAHTFCRNFRKSFDFQQLNFLVIEQATRPGERIAVIDATFLTKAGRKTYGLAKFWSGCDSKVKTGLELSVLSVVDTFKNQAFTLSVAQTPAHTPNDESRLDGYILQIQNSADALRKLHILTLAADGYYAKSKFVAAIEGLQLELISKLRRDARLKYLFSGPKTGKKGRPKLFDGVFNPLETSKLEPVAFDKNEFGEFEAFTGVLWASALKKKIRLVLIRPKNQPEKYCLLFSTRPETNALDVVRQYRKRFQIEFIFRDAKQNLGLGDCQSLRKDAQSFHHQSALATLNLLKAENLSPDQPNQTFSIQNAQRRYQNQFMLQTILAQVGLKPEVALNPTQILNILNIGLIHKQAA